MKYFGSFSGKLALIVVGALFMHGCSSFFSAANWGRLLSNQSALQELSIIAAEDVNDGYPVALDIVFVKEQPVYDALANLRATEWFAGKQDYLRQYQKKMAVMSWEVVPGQQFSKVILPDESHAAGWALVFADYPGARNFRSVIQYQRKVVIHLKQNDFELVQE